MLSIADQHVSKNNTIQVRDDRNDNISIILNLSLVSIRNGVFANSNLSKV